MSEQALKSRADAAPLDDERIQKLAFREIDRALQSIARVRFGVGVVFASLSALFAVFDGLSWKVILLTVVAFLALGLALRKPSGITSARSVGTLFLAIYAFHTVVILVTGGIESPFIVLYIPVTVLFAVAAGDGRLFLSIASFPITASIVFTGLRIFDVGQDLVPGVLGASAQAYSSLYWLTFGTVMVVIMLVGGFLGTELRRALNRTVRAAAEARAETLAVTQERNVELIELIGALAHELKNPLACIQGLGELVGRSLPEDAKAAEQMGVVNAEVKRMVVTIEEFLTFSRPLQELALEEVDPLVLAADVVGLHEAAAMGRHVSLHADGNAGLSVRCDPRKLRQVLVNLVQNALDAAPDGGEVAVMVSRNDADVELVVDDDGAGFGEGVSRFFTAGLTTKSGGSGLGLTIARVIVEQHGGALALSTRPEGGGRVRVRIPRGGPAVAPGQPEVVRALA